MDILLHYIENLENIMIAKMSLIRGINEYKLLLFIRKMENILHNNFNAV